MTPLIWISGVISDVAAARISPMDRGFTLGDGIFETVRVSAGAPLWLDDHFARLASGAAFLGIPVPLELDSLKAIVAALLERAAMKEAALRITLTRGAGSSAGLWKPDELLTPTLVVMCGDPPQPVNVAGVIARSTRRNEHSPLSRIKALNYGDSIAARREAIRRGAGDAILLNCRSRIACAAAGNIFVRIDGIWRTPPIDDGALPGLARARLLGALDSEQTELTESNLARADAALVSNSLGCTNLSTLEGRALVRAMPHLAVDQMYRA